jgi:hypothetical protein
VIDLTALRAALSCDRTWIKEFDDAWEKAVSRIHLAVFLEPFLRYVLDGSKTVESRFSVRGAPPYRRAAAGDILLLKRSGGPIVGICRAADVWHYELNARSWRQIERRFGRALRVEDSGFLEQKSHTSFATLIRLDRVLSIPAVGCQKKDRRGWVVVRDTEAQPTLFEALSLQSNP